MRRLAEAGWLTWVSYEPALGPVDWSGWEFLRWIVSGGESGPGARPSHPEWHRETRNFCEVHGIAYFFKQWGEWAPMEVCAEPAAHWTPCGLDRTHLFSDREPVFRIGKKASGRLLDGREWNEFPREATLNSQP